MEALFDNVGQLLDFLLFRLGINQQNIRFVHNDVITDVLQTIDDYNGQVGRFTQWLYKIEQDLSYLEDYCVRTDDANSTKQTVIELYQVNF